MTGCGLATVTPVACAFVSGAVRVTFMSVVAAPAAWSLASGALRITFGAGVAGNGEMCVRDVDDFLVGDPVSSTIGWPTIGPLLVEGGLRRRWHRLRE